MTDNYTDEHYAVIGDCSDTLVRETVYWLNDQYGHATVDDVAYFLAKRDGTRSLAETTEDVINALILGHIGNDDGCLLNTWDDMERMRRRSWFWTLDNEGEAVPAHLPGECMVVRAAVDDCTAAHGEASWSNLMTAVAWLAGYPDEDHALHAMLNALDAGAIAVDQGHGEKLVTAADGWREGLGS